jgi:hypothetical protein
MTDWRAHMATVQLSTSEIHAVVSTPESKEPGFRRAPALGAEAQTSLQEDQGVGCVHAV